MQNLLSKLLKNSLVFCLFSLPFLVYAADKAQLSPLTGFSFVANAKTPTQGMLYGPLDKDKLYSVVCQLDSANTEKLIGLEICHAGKADDNQICNKTTKKINITLNKTPANNTFTFKNLAPIELNKKWSKALHADYIIALNVKTTEEFKDKDEVKGSCDIKPEA